MEAFDFSRISIVALLDRSEANARSAVKRFPAIRNARIIDPHELRAIEFDYVAICSDLYAPEMLQMSLSAGVPEEKICYARNETVPLNSGLQEGRFEALRRYFIQTARNNEILSRLMLKTADLKSNYLGFDMAQLGRARHLREFFSKASGMRYVRVSTLELLFDQIITKSVPGCLAELGVFQGTFAALVNDMLPDRPLYLFDTFDGFDKRDVEYELENSMLNAGRADEIGRMDETFKRTSLDMVLSRMRSPGACVIKQGYFPETAADIGEDITFAFVSIDTDLYAPTYEGLKFFYPRLNRGGYIMIHDYNYYSCDGVKQAVDRFCSECSAALVPVSDVYGSVIIPKS